VTTDLPDGFSALWMETTDIGLSCGMEPFDAQPDAADQLCRLLSCAPDSYRRGRGANCTCRRPQHVMASCRPLQCGRPAAAPTKIHEDMMFRMLQSSKTTQAWAGHTSCVPRGTSVLQSIPRILFRQVVSQPTCGCARRELRLGPSATAPAGAADQYQLGVELTWQIGTRGTPERVQQDTHVVMGGGIAGVARELDRVAAGHGLTVSVPDSRQHITLSRT